MSELAERRFLLLGWATRARLETWLDSARGAGLLDLDRDGLYLASIGSPDTLRDWLDDEDGADDD